VQVHWKVPPALAQVPPLRHGLGVHAAELWQLVPE
jgi:hypothetical protein